MRRICGRFPVCALGRIIFRNRRVLSPAVTLFCHSLYLALHPWASSTREISHVISADTLASNFASRAIKQP